ncbi:MAG: hypothetical protein V4463_03050 [Pseudomonadota bacterium]
MMRPTLCPILGLALCLATAGASAQSVSMGRLFNTPQERSNLDAQRGTVTSTGAQAPVPAPVVQAPPPPPEPYTLNGIVKRSDGKTTVWINGVAQEDQNNVLAGTAKSPALKLKLSSGRKVILKPGQSYNVTERTIKDVDATQ